MNFYLLFTDTGKYMGYTDTKKIANKIIEQRKDFQTLYIEKFTEKMMNDTVKRDLYMSEGEIYQFYKIYLFEHEEWIVETKCAEYFQTLVNQIDDFFKSIPYLSFTEEEAEIIHKFAKQMNTVGNKMMYEYYSSEYPYKKLKIQGMLLDILKRYYTKKKKKVTVEHGSLFDFL